MEAPFEAFRKAFAEPSHRLENAYEGRMYENMSGYATPSSPAGSLWGHPRLFRRRRILNGRFWSLLSLLVTLVACYMLVDKFDYDAIKETAVDFSEDVLRWHQMRDLHFFPVTNQFHFVGRWIATPNRLRKDGTFPGVYFDIQVRNTTAVYLALHNIATDEVHRKSTYEHHHIKPDVSLAPPGRLSFKSKLLDGQAAGPVSLIARIDDEEYVLLPNCSGIVSILRTSLSQTKDHKIRIIAPMTEGTNHNAVQLEGVWLSKGASLQSIDGVALEDDMGDHATADVEDNTIGQSHRASLKEIGASDMNRFRHQHHRHAAAGHHGTASIERKKLLEIITDFPGSYNARTKNKHFSKAHELLAGVLGWEFLLGEMFGVDHANVGMDGMCLIQDCIGGVGAPTGVGDVFFRSGPYGSQYFDHGWVFGSTAPDAIVINVGHSDYTSFVNHFPEYNKTMQDLHEGFVNTYMSLVKGIRSLSYPKHPAIIHHERLGRSGGMPTGMHASIPIFIMRPLRGELERLTQQIVAKLRYEGDRSVFWLDTSGWLKVEDGEKPSKDFVLDPSAVPPQWRLTEQGNQRAAIFLHTHVCRYLARNEAECPFSDPNVYTGTMYDPEEATLDHFMENEKLRRLRSIFW